VRSGNRLRQCAARGHTQGTIRTIATERENTLCPPADEARELHGPGAASRETDAAAGCKRYFDAIAAHDLDALLDAMTPDYSRQLRDLRRLPDFGAFFKLWCESPGRLCAVISSAVRGNWATVALDLDNALVFARLRLFGGRWLIDSERVTQASKAPARRKEAAPTPR